MLVGSGEGKKKARSIVNEFFLFLLLTCFCDVLLSNLMAINLITINLITINLMVITVDFFPRG